VIVKVAQTTTTIGKSKSMSDITNLVPYDDYTDEAAEDEAAALAEVGSDVVKFPVGESVWRILPSIDGSGTPFKKVWQHFIKLPGMERGVSFACPRKHSRRYCPSCVKASELRKSGSKLDRDVAGELTASYRVYANAIHRLGGGNASGPHTLAFGKSIHEQLNDLKRSKHGGNFSHPINGYDIIVTRKGTGLNTEYKVDASREDSQLSESVEQMNDWITGQNDLSHYAIAPEREELESMLTGVFPDAGARALPAGGARRQRRRSAQDDIIEGEAE
jgi:hypothetical protein